jgi:hypothetical protein
LTFSPPAVNISMEEPKEKRPRIKEAKTRRLGTKVVEGVIVGRDKKVIPPREVQKLAEIGCKDIEICVWFGIDENTLTYNFRRELDVGREHLKQSLRRAQIALALSGNPTMLIWLGKNILGQTDQPLNTEASQPLPWSDNE